MIIKNVFCLQKVKLDSLRVFLSMMWILSAILLQGCTEVKKTLGIERTAPEEFDVIENAPLIIPPYSHLPVPMKDSSVPLNPVAPKEAEAALLGNPLPAVIPLKSATTDAVPKSSIKQTIDEEANSEIFQDNRPEWLKKLFFWQKKQPGTILNPEDESIALKKPSISEISPKKDDLRDTFLVSPEATTTSLSDDTIVIDHNDKKTSVIVPEIETVQVVTSMTDPELAITVPVKPGIPCAVAIPDVVATVQVNAVKRSSQELYGSTVPRKRLTDSVQQARVYKPVLLTKSLPSTTIINKYIDVRQKKPKVVSTIKKPKPIPIPTEPAQDLTKDATEKDALSSTENRTLERNSSKTGVIVDPVSVNEVSPVLKNADLSADSFADKSSEGSDVSSSVSEKTTNIQKELVRAPEQAESIELPSESKEIIEMPAVSGDGFSTDPATEDPQTHSNQDSTEGEKQ